MAGFLGTVSGQVRLNIRQAVAAYATMRAENARLTYALRGTGDSFVHAGRTMTVAGGVMVYAFAQAVRAAADFERKMDFFAAVSDTNSAKMRQLSKFTLQLAQDTIYSASQVADGMIELGKAGVSAEQIMAGIGVAMTNLGAASDIPLAQSGQIITSTIQQFDLAATDAVRVVDLLAGAANASIADISDIGVSLKYVGGVANAAGLSFEDTATAISLLAKAGIRGSTAGTSLRQMIVSLSGATGPAREALEKIGITQDHVNNKFYDAQGNLKPLAQVFQLLQTHLKGYNAQQRLSILRTLFNNRALSAAAILTRDGAKGFKEMYGEMRKTSAADVAHKRLDNLSGDIEILRGNVETFMTQAGGPFQETMRGWVQNITKVVQAFQKLSPANQKFIVETIGITGAVLVAMGAISILLGTIFKFAANMLKLAAAISFVMKWLRGFLYLVGIITGGALSATVIAIIAVVLALAIAFVVLYKKVKPFRDFVNSMAKGFVDHVVKPMVKGVQELIKWFSNFGSNMSKLWDDVKNGASSAGNAIVSGIKSVPGLISRGLQAGINAVVNFVGTIVAYFLSLPGKVGSALNNFGLFLKKVFTLENIGYAVGFALGRALKYFIEFRVKLFKWGLQLIQTLGNLFRNLGQAIVSHIVNFIAKAIIAWVNFQVKLQTAAYNAVVAIGQFFQQLPGRIATFLAQAVTTLISKGQEMVSWARTNGPKIANNLVQGLISLPGRIAVWLGKAVSTMTSWIGNFFTAAFTLGMNLVSGIQSMIATLPSLVWGILGQVVQAFKDMASSAAKSALEFGKGLVSGFLDGIDMHSPSAIERAMFQINDTMKEETKKLRRHTLGVRALSMKLAKDQFTTGSVTASGQVMATLSAARAVQNKMATSGANPVVRSTRSESGSSSGTPQSRIVGGKLSIDEKGQAFLVGVAQDVTSANNQLDAEATRRNGER